MSTKHKHRRSNSTNIEQYKQNANTNQNQLQSKKIEFKQLNALFCEGEVMHLINTSTMRVQNKQTIVEELDQVWDRSQKRRRNLREIQQDLQNWDEFQVNFLNTKMHKYMKTEITKNSKTKLYFPKKSMHKKQKHEELLKPQIQNLSFQSRRILKVK